MRLQQRVQVARQFEPDRFLRFVADGATLGYVRHDLVAHLRRYADVFEIDAQAVCFRAYLDDYARRSEALAVVARELAAAGLLTPWRAETYDIRPVAGGPALCVLERAAVRFFGFTAHAVHVNGIVEADVGTAGAALWIARRSPNKAIDPDMLDTMVGGGLATGLSIPETLVKEAWEEAGVPAALASTARAAGTLHVLREVPEGLHAETIYAYDLVVPPDFVPCNQDGEVAEFRRLTVPEVLRELASDAPYTIDAGLVTYDCLARRGLIDPI